MPSPRQAPQSIRCRRSPFGATACRDRVERRVGRGIVRLARGTQTSGRASRTARSDRAAMRGSPVSSASAPCSFAPNAASSCARVIVAAVASCSSAARWKTPLTAATALSRTRRTASALPGRRPRCEPSRTAISIFDRATRQQQQMPRALPDHPGGELAADRAGAAADHVGRVAAEARAAERQLADMARAPAGRATHR